MTSVLIPTDRDMGQQNVSKVSIDHRYVLTTLYTSGIFIDCQSIVVKSSTFLAQSMSYLQPILFTKLIIVTDAIHSICLRTFSQKAV